LIINYLINHPTNTITMMVPFAATAAWIQWMSPPHPWEPLQAEIGGRVLVRSNDPAKKKID
jgi:hypothetical protein